MNNVFTVPQVPGSKRTSPRNYSHAIIGQYDYDAAITSSSKIDKHQASGWEYASLCSGCTAGQTYPKPGYEFPVTQEMIDSGKQIIEEFPTVDLYLAGMRDRRLAYAMEAKAKNEGKWVVLQWSQSFQNASKGMSAHKWHKNLKVVETLKIK